MIYTIGREESYTRYFQEQGRPIKLGRNGRDDYPGGSVWKTEEEARENCPEGYAVYGLMADWEMDTEPSKEGNWHDLLINAELVQLDTLGVQ
jgi:hypothetical protein